MNQAISRPVAMALAMLASLAGLAAAQHHYGQAPIEAAPPPAIAEDERVPLKLEQAPAAGLTLTMREHLEAVHGIVAALGREEFQEAALLAERELGFTKHHEAMKREAGATFPPKYHELAMAHHQAAEDLAAVIPSRDMRQILSHLGRTVEACVACHRTYRL